MLALHAACSHTCFIPGYTVYLVRFLSYPFIVYSLFTEFWQSFITIGVSVMKLCQISINRLSDKTVTAFNLYI